jgi:hypothetical protein
MTSSHVQHTRAQVLRQMNVTTQIPSKLSKPSPTAEALLRMTMMAKRTSTQRATSDPLRAKKNLIRYGDTLSISDQADPIQHDYPSSPINHATASSPDDARLEPDIDALTLQVAQLGHTFCLSCGYHASNRGDLLDHCEETGCYTVCRGCDNGQGKIWPPNSAAFMQHLEDHNVHLPAGKHFDTPEELEQVRSPPAARNTLTPRSPGTPGLDFQAAVSGASKRYMFAGRDEQIWQGYAFADSAAVYFCPTCETPVSRLSSLFRHVESSECAQTLDDGPIGLLCRNLADEMPTFMRPSGEVMYN